MFARKTVIYPAEISKTEIALGKKQKASDTVWKLDFDVAVSREMEQTTDKRFAHYFSDSPWQLEVVPNFDACRSGNDVKVHRD